MRMSKLWAVGKWCDAFSLKGALSQVLPLPVRVCTGFLLILCANVVVSAELLVIEQQGCAFCARFNSEISVAYPRTEEGKLAPLVRVDLQGPWPERYSGIEPGFVTPTFILIENDREVDRLVGYPGDEHFWFLLSEMLDKL